MAPNARAALVARILLIGGGLFILLPFSTDVYLTAMVDLGREFGVAMAGVQRTMLSFTLGFGLAHLFIGDVADRYGRRNTALVGVGLYVFASVLAGVSPSLNLLILGAIPSGPCGGVRADPVAHHRARCRQAGGDWRSVRQIGRTRSDRADNGAVDWRAGGDLWRLARGDGGARDLWLRARGSGSGCDCRRRGRPICTGAEKNSEGEGAETSCSRIASS